MARSPSQPKLRPLPLHASQALTAFENACSEAAFAGAKEPTEADNLRLRQQNAKFKLLVAIDSLRG